MQPRIGRNFFSHIEICFAFCLIVLCATTLRAEPTVSNVLVRDNVTSRHRSELILRLRAITGWSTIDFDSAGMLRVGDSHSNKGSLSARNLVSKAIAGANVIVLEEADANSDVVFCRVLQARWTGTASGKPVYVVQIDFADFRQVFGDRRAREAFDVGWGVLHELDHVVNDSQDSLVLEGAGECEENLNAMRRELNLPERTEYFYTFLGHDNAGAFKGRFVRLAFRQHDRQTNKNKRYWLLWDAEIVGGLTTPKQLASTR